MTCATVLRATSFLWLSLGWFFFSFQRFHTCWCLQDGFEEGLIRICCTVCYWVEALEAPENDWRVKMVKNAHLIPEQYHILRILVQDFI